MKNGLLKVWVVLTTFLLIMQISSQAQHRAITFETGTWKEIMAKAASAHKMVFLDGYATWCGPCKVMATTVFTRDSIADFYNEHFICAKIDMEKGEGLRLGQFYDVGAYPTYLYLDAEGNVIHRCCGLMPATTFLRVGQDAVNPERQFVTLRDRYVKGERDKNFLLQYFDVISKSCTDVGYMLDEYLATQKDEDLLSQVNWQMISRFVTNVDSREFNFLLNNILAFSKITTEDSINTKIYNCFLRPAYKAAISTDSLEWPLMQRRIRKAKFSRADELIFTINMLRYATKNDMKTYEREALKYTETYKSKDAVFLYEASGRIAENTKDPKVLRIVLDWAERANALDNRTEFRTNLAKVMYKNDRKEEAIRKMESAIDDANKNGENTDAYVQILKDWKSKK